MSIRSDNLYICLVNYAHVTPPSSQSDIKEKQKLQTAQALKAGVTTVYNLGFEDIVDTPLYFAHKELLDNARGAGYWLWKPYIILKTMLETKLKYDVYIYLDSDIQITGSVVPFAMLTKEQAVVAIRTTYQQARFCKRDCSVAFQVEDNAYTQWYQIQAGTVAYANTPEAVMFLTDWMVTCCNHHFINDEPSVISNFPFFLDNRHDQALFTLVYRKYGFKVYPPVTQSFCDLWPLPSLQTQVEGEFTD